MQYISFEHGWVNDLVPLLRHLFEWPNKAIIQFLEEEDTTIALWDDAALMYVIRACDGCARFILSKLIWQPWMYGCQPLVLNGEDSPRIAPLESTTPQFQWDFREKVIRIVCEALERIRNNSQIYRPSNKRWNLSWGKSTCHYLF
jgi:hypothetical protein